MPKSPVSPAPAIDEHTVINRSGSFLVAPVHDEIVMMDIGSGHYYGLDDIGSVIWQRLEQPQTFGDLIDSLVAEFDADRAVIAADVRKLLAHMAGQKVVSFDQGS